MKIAGYEVHPAADIFVLLPDDELQRLADDIKERGLIEAITLCKEVLLDGRNRLLACKRSGVIPRFEQWHSRTDDPEKEQIDWIVSKNLRRRHLDTSQRGMVAADLLPVYERAAKARQVAVLKRGTVTPVVANLPPRSTAPAQARARAQAAAQVNVSPRIVQDAKTVKEKAAPEIALAVRQGKLAVSAAAQLVAFPKAQQKEIARRVVGGTPVREVVREMKREECATHSEPKQPAGVPKRYRVLYVDPPWQYGDTRAGLADYAATAAEDHYPTMSVEELSVLKPWKRSFKDLATDDAVLFCWATFPLLPDCLAVVKAWGFVYKTAFIWAKGRPNFGHYHDASAELLLVCTRGSGVPDSDKREKQVQLIERTGRHSAKPEEFRALIDRLYTHGHKLELFRRGRAPADWDVWGNEATDA